MVLIRHNAKTGIGLTYLYCNSTGLSSQIYAVPHVARTQFVYVKSANFDGKTEYSVIKDKVAVK